MDTPIITPTALAPALKPLSPERLYVREFNAEATWEAALQAIQEGHRPDTVAEALFDMLDTDDLASLHDAAPVHRDSPEVPATGTEVLLCRSMDSMDSAKRWEPNITRASIHAMIDAREETLRALLLALPALAEAATVGVYSATNARAAAKTAIDLMSLPST